MCFNKFLNFTDFAMVYAIFVYNLFCVSWKDLQSICVGDTDSSLSWAEIITHAPTKVVPA